MKRSVFVGEEIENAMVELGCGPAEAGTIAHRIARAAERAGVTWDPEEPEVLWECATWRLTADGSWRKLYRGEWTVTQFLEQNEKGPVFAELARRILEERKAEEELDDAMDEAERKFTEDLGKLEQQDRRQKNDDLLDAFRFALSASAPGPSSVFVDAERYRNLVALWALWGPEGTLRKKLVDSIEGAAFDQPVTSWRNDTQFRMLRSELLALPWAVMK
jgi:hypothetical protein